MANPTQHTVHASTQSCPRCGAQLVEVRPDMDGWRHYCRICETLTLTAVEAEAALAAVPEGAVGAVVSVSHKLEIEWAGVNNARPAGGG